MIDATFKHKVKGSNDYDAVIQAREADAPFRRRTRSSSAFFSSDSEIQTSPAMPMSS